jgi:uncharacterized membrane protein
MNLLMSSKFSAPSVVCSVTLGACSTPRTTNKPTLAKWAAQYGWQPYTWNGEERPLIGDCVLAVIAFVIFNGFVVVVAIWHLRRDHHTKTASVSPGLGFGSRLKMRETNWGCTAE